MATFSYCFGTLSLSSPPFFFTPIRYHLSLNNQPRLGLFHKTRHPRLRLLQRVNCSSSGSPRDAEPNLDPEPIMPPAPPSSSPDWTYKLTAGIAGIGLLETSYLTYLKLTDSDVFCPTGGGTCGDILDSDYAVVFGVPLSLIGMAAYGLVSALGLQLASKNLPFGINKSNAQLILLGCTTSMAAASAYFLYILSTRFSGSSCSYCLLSALLSFSLFFITVKDVGLQETQKQVGLQLFIASLVILTLNTSYSNSKSVSSSMAQIELPYHASEISIPSSPFALSLANYLHSIGAKMYGAFWCSHCLEQKEIFGHEAAKLLDYVECFPEGYRTGTKMIKACTDARIEGFPTWVINGQVLSGKQELTELAQVSGYNESVQPS